MGTTHNNNLLKKIVIVDVIYGTIDRFSKVGGVQRCSNGVSNIFIFESPRHTSIIIYFYDKRSVRRKEMYFL
jgi:hypothetical protein